MRPTLLNFRSPKEKTPFYFDPKVTYDGRILSFSSPKGSGKTSSFSSEKRFKWYQSLQGSNHHVGPGSYSPLCSRYGKIHIRSGSPYRKPYALVDDITSGHLMVGDQIVYDTDLLINNKNRTLVGSDNKISTQQSSYENEIRNFKVRRFTPDPLLRTPMPKIRNNSKPYTLFNLQKIHRFAKVEKILKKRFKAKLKMQKGG